MRIENKIRSIWSEKKYIYIWKLSPQWNYCSLKVLRLNRSLKFSFSKLNLVVFKIQNMTYWTISTMGSCENHRIRFTQIINIEEVIDSSKHHPSFMYIWLSYLSDLTLVFFTWMECSMIGQMFYLNSKGVGYKPGKRPCLNRKSASQDIQPCFWGYSWGSCCSAKEQS